MVTSYFLTRRIFFSKAVSQQYIFTIRMDLINSAMVLIRSSVTRNIRSLQYQQKLIQRQNLLFLLKKSIDGTIDCIK